MPGLSGETDEFWRGDAEEFRDLAAGAAAGFDGATLAELPAPLPPGGWRGETPGVEFGDPARGPGALPRGVVDADVAGEVPGMLLRSASSMRWCAKR